MKKRLLFVALFIFPLFNQALSQSVWTPLTSGTTVNLSHIQFVNQYTGWACGSQAIPTRYALIKTTDGGVTWISQLSSLAIGNRLISLFFIDENTGWIAGAEGIQKTTNGGDNFFYQKPAPGIYNSVFFINSLTGWAAGLSGANGIIVYTSDGGTNWSTQTSGQFSQLYSVCFANSATGWSVGGSDIIATTNAGVNWSLQNSGTKADLKSVFAFSPEMVWASGTDGTVLRSSNGGLNWLSQNTGSSVTINSVIFTTFNDGYAVGDSLIFRTGNSGAKWDVQQAVSGANLRSISFAEGKTGFLCGTRGVIYKSSY